MRSSSSTRARFTRRSFGCSSGAGSWRPGARPTTTAKRSSIRSPGPDENSSSRQLKTGGASRASWDAYYGSPIADAMPSWFLVLASRIHGLLRRRSLDDDFESELGSHLDLLSEEYGRRGLTAAEARRAAVLRLGGLTQLKEQHREGRSVPWVETSLF